MKNNNYACRSIALAFSFSLLGFATSAFADSCPNEEVDLRLSVSSSGSCPHATLEVVSTSPGRPRVGQAVKETIRVTCYSDAGMKNQISSFTRYVSCINKY